MSKVNTFLDNLLIFKTLYLYSNNERSSPTLRTQKYKYFMRSGLKYVNNKWAFTKYTYTTHIVVDPKYICLNESLKLLNKDKSKETLSSAILIWLFTSEMHLIQQLCCAVLCTSNRLEMKEKPSYLNQLTLKCTTRKLRACIAWYYCQQSLKTSMWEYIIYTIQMF